jgi:hypothetical protein
MDCQAPRAYRAFAALHEDTDKGWVWLRLEETNGFVSRSTIKIVRGQYSVYCEYRSFDENFVRTYDATGYTKCMYFSSEKAVGPRSPVDLSQLHDVIVISGWYRNALGGFKTEGFGGGRQELIVCKPWFSAWGDLRAACQHPEPGVRVATRVAILGTWLGVAALLPALADVEPIRTALRRYFEYPALIALSVAALFGLLCLVAGRGIKHPAKRSIA